jgi:hypothetical protein
MLYRYSRWDGSQNIAAFTAEDLLNAMADDLIADGDVESALQRIIRNGADAQDGRMRGLQDLLNRLRERKQQQLNRYRLDSLMDDLKKRLDEVIKTEREGIQRKLEQASPDGNHSPSNESPNQSADSPDSNQNGNRSDKSGNQPPGRQQSGQSPSGQQPANRGKQSSRSQSDQSSDQQSPADGDDQSADGSGMNPSPNPCDVIGGSRCRTGVVGPVLIRLLAGREVTKSCVSRSGWKASTYRPRPKIIKLLRHCSRTKARAD